MSVPKIEQFIWGIIDKFPQLMNEENIKKIVIDALESAKNFLVVDENGDFVKIKKSQRAYRRLKNRGDVSGVPLPEQLFVSGAVLPEQLDTILNKIKNDLSKVIVWPNLRITFRGISIYNQYQENLNDEQKQKALQLIIDAHIYQFLLNIENPNLAESFRDFMGKLKKDASGDLFVLSLIENIRKNDLYVRSRHGYQMKEYSRGNMDILLHIIKEVFFKNRLF